MLSVDPKELKVPQLQSYLLHAVAPRPIALASTISKSGEPNLAPFSFFNIFSSNPPIAIFSPARSGRTGQTKHTHENILEIPEVVINTVSYAMVQQMSLTGAEYPRGVNEFEKAGFTMLASEKIRPFRVKESPIQFECLVKEIKEMGTQSGAGNLIICEIIRLHIREENLDDKGMMDQRKLDFVGRAGANWYTRTNGDALFEVNKPLAIPGIGVDQLPEDVRHSKVLTGNNLGQLGNLEKLPTKEEIASFRNTALFQNFGKSGKESLHLHARTLIEHGQVQEALCLLLAVSE